MTKRDQAMLVCIGNSIRIVSRFNQQADHLEDALKDYQNGKNVTSFFRLGAPEIHGGGMAFYDAIVNTSRELGGQAGRRAIILFSDGEDNSSAKNLLDAIESAQECGAINFSIRYSELKRGVWTARNKYGRSTPLRATI